ncbi:sigma-70 family RNA polymerase sigma factor [Paenibacillus macerans]|uniref:sigma-70 family RNA polymerase sigma factor n=1 Tax=Paenibacillus macerans TaxID=44252 RepID=UPI002DB5E886|nr:sigma-70 family RNA polymerase sigma factor [Paenibacillus macerans]MEC0328760.1 sigma-70 family RNA polymerase sigma factor [Paenibacillus macerans]
MSPQHPDNPLLGPQSRADFITQNMRLVYAAAQPFRSRAEALVIPLEDVISEGTIGLILAYDRYSDASKPFPSFATAYILGYIRNYFRQRADAIRVPRRLYNAVQRIISEGLDAAPDDEVARILGISAEIAKEAKYCAMVRRADTLDVDAEKDDEWSPKEPGVTFDDTGPDVTAFLGELAPRQQEIVRLMMRGYSQSETARIIGISRQATEQAIRRIRAHYERLNPAAA